jgi:hypothetical protein
MGLTSVFLSIRYFVRTSDNPVSLKRRNGNILALIAGLTCIILAGLHLAYSTGGFGTGTGKAGSLVAMILGLTGIILALLSLVRLNKP